MFLPPSFTPTTNLATAANVSSSGFNVFKANFDNFLSLVGSYYFNQIASGSAVSLNPTSLVNTINSSTGATTITLPSLSVAINNGVKLYSFKRIDNSNYAVIIQGYSGEGVESFGVHSASPSNLSIKLQLIDEEVILLPTSSGWRIVNHYIPTSLLSCSIGLNSNQAISAGTPTVVQFNNTTGSFFDNHSLFDTSANAYQCLISGYYLITGILSFQSSSSASHQWAKLYLDNGSGFQDIVTLIEFDIGTGVTRYNFSYSLKLQEGNKIRIMTANDNISKTILASNNSVFAVQLTSF